MLFTRWQKQNSQIKSLSWVIAAVAAFLVALIFWSRGPEFMGGVAVALAFVFRFTLTFIANRLYPDTLSGALRVDHEKLSLQLNTALKEQGIHFYGTTRKKSYSYEFPEQNLIMAIKSHKMPSSKGHLRDAAMVTFQNLDSSNTAFADKITGEIDQVVESLTEQSA